MSQGFTLQQLAAIEARGLSVALAAGAGCGKTTVLTSRFLGRLVGDDRLGLNEIVAVTFTDKAARELRSRVRGEARRQLAGSVGEELAHWKAIVRGLESAAIQTFHGFCGEILRKWPIEAGIEPEFAILDEAIAPSFLDQTLDDYVRDRLSDQEPDLIASAVEFGLGPLRDAIARALTSRDRNELLRWSATEPEEAVANWQRLWKSQVFPTLLAELGDEAQPLLKILSDHVPTHPKMIERRSLLLAEIPLLAASRDPIAALASIFEAARVQGGGSAKNWPSSEIYEEVKARLAALRESITNLIKLSAFDPVATLDAARLGRRFARLAAGALEAYDRAKSAAGVVDFDDLMQRTLALLRDGPTAVREAIRAQCQALLVDEFQDTDPVQGSILRQLAGDSLDAGRLFLVGDAKQSIYGFRGARPEVFDEFRRAFRAEGRLTLNQNFRSVPGILNFVNALFARVFPGADQTLAPVRIGAESSAPVVEFVWAHESEPTQKPTATERRKLEARWLARLVARRLEEGWMVVPKRGEPARAATAGDVVFLFRSMTDVAAYEQALAAEGIDYQVVGGSAFYGQQEVIDLINLLTAIEDPFDEVSLAGALRGPFFCISDEALYWLAAEPGGLTMGFENHFRVSNLNRRDASCVSRAHILLSRWRAAKDHGSIAGLIDLALAESGAEAALVGEFLGRRKQANVRKLVRLARRFDLQGGYTLADFVARLRNDLRKPPREELAATTDQESKAVRLMTIHQAKGLEFPIVVIPDLDRKSEESRSFVATHPQVGLVVRPPLEGESDGDQDDPEAETSGQSLGWMLHRQITQREGRDEAHRLLYVATTRAMDHLILSAAAGPLETPHSHALKLLATRFDRSTGRLLDSTLENYPDPVIGVIVEPPESPLAKRATPHKPDLAEIAHRIRQLARDPAQFEPPRPRPARSRTVRLDPAAGLPPLSARLDRLIRAAMVAAPGFDPRSIESVLTRVGRDQEPATSPDLISQAIDRLSPWLAGSVGESLAVAEEIRRGIPWSIAWPERSDSATVFQGTIDLAVRHSDGFWQLLSISDARSSDSADRLRSLLPAAFSTTLGLGRVVQVSRLRLGPGGGLRHEHDLDDRAIQQVVAAFFAAMIDG